MLFTPGVNTELSPPGKAAATPTIQLREHEHVIPSGHLLPATKQPINQTHSSSELMIDYRNAYITHASW